MLDSRANADGATGVGYRERTKRMLNRTVVALLALIFALGPASVTIASRIAASPEAAATPVIPPGLFDEFGRRGIAVDGTQIDVILASADYMRAAGRDDLATVLDVGRSLVVLVTLHVGNTSTQQIEAISLRIRIDGGEEVSAQERRLLTRGSDTTEIAFVFKEVDPIALSENHLVRVSLQLPAQEGEIAFDWITPLSAEDPAPVPTNGTPEPTSESMIDVMETVIPSEDVEVCG